MADKRPAPITSARRSHSEEVRARQTRYLISMGIRTVCVVLAVVTSGYVRWAFIVGAVVVPYIAVVIANAGARADPEGPEPFEPESRPMLPPGIDHAHREDSAGQESPGEDGSHSAQ